MKIKDIHTFNDLIEWGESHRPRDAQRIRVYRAEWAMSAWERKEDRLSTVNLMQSYVDCIVGESWFLERYGWLWNGQPYITVKDGRRRKTACGDYYRSTISVPKDMRYKEVILHEICHVITPNIYSWHGPEFCTNLLLLVDRWLPGDYIELKILMKENMVHHYAFPWPPTEHENLVCKPRV